MADAAQRAWLLASVVQDSESPQQSWPLEPHGLRQSHMYWFAMLDVHASFGRQQSCPDVPHGEAQLAVMPVATGEIKVAVVVLDAEVTNGVIVALGTGL